MLDFDGTITMKDTMLAYGTIADNRDVRLGRRPTGSETFKNFGTAWMDDYSAHGKDYSPKPEDRKDIMEEITWLASLAKIESASARRVEQSEFFRHVNRDDVQKASESLLENGNIALRAGWQRLFEKAASQSDPGVFDVGDSGLHLSINSVNWSETFIRATMKNAARRSSLDTRISHSIDSMVIKANELYGLDDPDGASGCLDRKDSMSTRTAEDKSFNLTALQMDNTHYVYVGDSPTDLQCLLAADLGICIRNDPLSSSSKELADVFARTGYEVPHVSDCKSWSDRHFKGDKSALLWARDFDEIADLFDRLQGSVQDK